MSAPLGQTTGRPAVRSVTLLDAAREFARHPSGWILAISAVSAVTVRVVLGGWAGSDAIVAVGLVAAFPVTEWVIHVVLLHWRPRTVGGRRIDPLVARKHREHHAGPRELALVFIPLRTLAKSVVATIVVAVVIFPRLELAATFVATQALLGTVYEWTHYLVHTDYRPRTALFRAVWRNHRLHHYKNERYWFTVTTEGTADRLFGTYPSPADVETSPTARALHADVA